MGLITRFKNAVSALTLPSTDSQEELMKWLGIDKNGKNQKAINEITYFTCLKMLSETMGKLPIKYYRETENGKEKATMTRLGALLTVRPNPYMTPTTLWTTTELNTQQYGNGFIWIRRVFHRHKYGGEYIPYDVWPLQSRYVDLLMDDAGILGNKGKIYYRYSDPQSGEQHIFQSEEIMHFKTWLSFDGITGEPVKRILEESVGGMLDSQKFIKNLNKSGLTASMAMQYSGDLDDARRKKLASRFIDKMSGPMNAGKVIPVPTSLQLVPLKMSMVDAQFFELRKYSALQIAGAFGIKPNQINDYEHSSYANSEMQQINFLTDTVSYRIKVYEDEINAKCLSIDEINNGNFYKINEKAILRTDSKTQMEVLADGVQNGIYTPNEAREYIDMPWKYGGDILMANGNFIPVTEVGNQYRKGENNGENTD